MRCWTAIGRATQRGAVATLCLTLAACATAHVPGSGIDGGALSARADRLILVTIANPRGPMVGQPGSTPHGYDRWGDYAVGDQARAVAAALERDYGLRRVREWPIASLRVHCLVFALPPQAARAPLLQRLAADRRVRLAQPLQLFAARSGAPSYNDPYFALQSGFSAIDAAAAQRWSSGAGVQIAIIDTGVDRQHPDLTGRIGLSADFVDGARREFDGDRHGTAVAGVIGAVANNGLGIVGVAPGALLQIYKACEPAQHQTLEALCNSFTLALALSAAIDAHAQIVNLSLGGPADPLLTQLVQLGSRRGMVFVGAVPQDGNLSGFPLGIPGVIAVDVSGRESADHSRHVLYAPGRDIVTLAPGGHYDFASGSSFAAAHVSGAIALLLARASHLDAQRLFATLDRTRSQLAAGTTINVCAALAALRPSDDCRQTARTLATVSDR
jgi:subtilisin family serine protease